MSLNYLGVIGKFLVWFFFFLSQHWRRGRVLKILPKNTPYFQAALTKPNYLQSGKQIIMKIVSYLIYQYQVEIMEILKVCIKVTE